MSVKEQVHAALSRVLDPEMPINIVDLGLVEEVRVEDASAGARVSVRLLPTFVGCPALDVIRDDVCAEVGAIPGVARVEVRFEHSPPWSVERISPAGREALRELGITVPALGHACGADANSGPASRVVPLTISTNVACPFCNSTSTHMESRFGPTRCKMIYYCDACRNTFERLKPV